MEASIYVVNTFPNLLLDSPNDVKPDTVMGGKLLLIIVGDYFGCFSATFQICCNNHVSVSLQNLQCVYGMYSGNIQTLQVII